MARQFKDLTSEMLRKFNSAPIIVGFKTLTRHYEAFAQNVPIIGKLCDEVAETYTDLEGLPDAASSFQQFLDDTLKRVYAEAKGFEKTLKRNRHATTGASASLDRDAGARASMHEGTVAGAFKNMDADADASLTNNRRSRRRHTSSLGLLERRNKFRLYILQTMVQSILKNLPRPTRQELINEYEKLYPSLGAVKTFFINSSEREGSKDTLSCNILYNEAKEWVRTQNRPYEEDDTAVDGTAEDEPAAAEVRGAAPGGEGLSAPEGSPAPAAAEVSGASSAVLSSAVSSSS